MASSDGKNPIVAFLLGLFFGAFGVGLYLQNWSDFLLCAGVYLFLIICAAPTVLSIPLAMLIGGVFCACYGAYRAPSR